MLAARGRCAPLGGYHQAPAVLRCRGMPRSNRPTCKEHHQICKRVTGSRRTTLPSVPPSAAVPSATEQQDDEDNDEKRSGIHVRLLRRCARICALRLMHSSCNRMLWSDAQFHMRHRSITTIGAIAKDDRPASRRGAHARRSGQRSMWLASKAVGLTRFALTRSTRCARLTVKESFVSAGAAKLKGPVRAFSSFGLSRSSNARCTATRGQESPALRLRSTSHAPSLVNLLRRLSLVAAEESGNRHSKRLVKRPDG